MACGQYRLQFLHISELHARGPAEEGQIHFVFFTGDAAQSGKSGEFSEVTGFFTELCAELGIGPDGSSPFRAISISTG